MKLNTYIDHTILKATATSRDIANLCEEAIAHDFRAVCVNSAFVTSAKEFLNGTQVKIASTVGFPLGAASTHSKLAEARQAINDGADEIDMVINIGKLKEGLTAEVEAEISDIKKAIGDKILKVILETCYLTETEILKVAEVGMNAGADFIKTSTGFGPRGASLEDIRIMKEAVGDKVKIKASGGIRDAMTALEYINLGVDRIGTSSGVKIVSEKSV